MSAPKNQDKPFLSIKNERLVIRKDVLIGFSINLAEECWIRFLKRCFSWHFTRQKNSLFNFHKIGIENKIGTQRFQIFFLIRKTNKPFCFFSIFFNHMNSIQKDMRM